MAQSATDWYQTPIIEVKVTIDTELHPIKPQYQKQTKHNLAEPNQKGHFGDSADILMTQGV